MRAQQNAIILFAVGAVAVEQRDLAECTDYAMSVFPSLTEFPTPDMSLVDFIAEQTELAAITDCEIPQVTGSLAEEWTSYMSELISFQSANSDILESLVEVCSDVPEISSAMGDLPPMTVCSDYTWLGNGSGGSGGSKTKTDTVTSATGTPNSDGDNNGEEGSNNGEEGSNNSEGGSSNDDNAAGRQTIAVGAALAAAGALIAAL
jgi:hypothetical protein